MIDGPPVNTAPPPSQTNHVFGFMVVPSMWSMDQNRRAVWDDAMEVFNASMIQLYRLPCFSPSQWRKEFELCQMCAGLVFMRDLMQPIPYHAAQVMDFFFGRDKAEALVYEWRPWEKDFALVSREWLNRRRRVKCG